MRNGIKRSNNGKNSACGFWSDRPVQDKRLCSDLNQTNREDICEKGWIEIDIELHVFWPGVNFTKLCIQSEQLHKKLHTCFNYSGSARVRILYWNDWLSAEVSCFVQRIVGAIDEFVTVSLQQITRRVTIHHTTFHLKTTHASQGSHISQQIIEKQLFQYSMKKFQRNSLHLSNSSNRIKILG